MEIAVYCFGALTVISGIISALAFGLHYRDVGIWTSCLAIILVTVGGFRWIQDREWKKDAAAKPKPKSKRIATTATPTPSAEPKKSRFSVIHDKFGLVIGGNTMHWSKKFMLENQPMHPITLEDTHCVTVQLVDDKLQVDAALFNADITLVGNELRGLPATWDANSDDSVFEIVNDAGLPVFQLEYRSDQLAVIRGIFAVRNDIFLVDEKQSRLVPRKADLVIIDNLKPIFKYPSKDHEHERQYSCVKQTETREETLARLARDARIVRAQRSVSNGWLGE